MGEDITAEAMYYCEIGMAAILEKVTKSAAPAMASTDDLGAGVLCCEAEPDISITDYLARIKKHTYISCAARILAFIYADRLLTLVPQCASPLHVHRMMLVTSMVASKTIDDRFSSNEVFARVGGVHLADLNSTELYFLFTVQFGLSVTEREFTAYAHHLYAYGKVHAAHQMGLALLENEPRAVQE